MNSLSSPLVPLQAPPDFAVERFRERLKPVLPDALLQEESFFRLYPPDIYEQDDEITARQTLAGELLADYGELPHLDYGRFEKWRTVEKSCLINRMYFLVPLAKYAALHRDQKAARLAWETMLSFIERYPPPATKQAVHEHQRRTYLRRDTEYNLRRPEEIDENEADVEYIWFDFQPASRLLHFYHAAYFLRPLIAANEAGWSQILFSIYQHALVILHGESDLPLTRGDNHQSLRAVALAYAGELFAGEPFAGELISEAVRIMDFHAWDGYFPDGVLKEISPSYHLMVCWQLRDLYLLSQRHGFGLKPATPDLLARQRDYIVATTHPGGLSAVFNSGREVETAPYLRSLDFLGQRATDSALWHFPCAGVSVAREPSRYLIFDHSAFTGRDSHYHGGKNGLTFWADGQPWLVDSGCPSYDHPLFANWFKQPQAHSSLLINGTGDSDLIGIYDWAEHALCECAGWQTDPAGQPQVSSLLRSTRPEWLGVAWRRTITLMPKDEVQIEDVVESTTAAQATLVWNLHPSISAIVGDGLATLSAGSQRFQLSWKEPSAWQCSKKQGWIHTGGQVHESTQLLLSSEPARRNRVVFSLQRDLSTLAACRTCDEN